jgi:hypothetical protein
MLINLLPDAKCRFIPQRAYLVNIIASLSWQVRLSRVVIFNLSKTAAPEI